MSKNFDRANARMRKRNKSYSRTMREMTYLTRNANDVVNVHESFIDRIASRDTIDQSMRSYYHRVHRDM